MSESLPELIPFIQQVHQVLSDARLQATGIYRFWPELLDREQARACPRSPGPEPALELRPRIALSSAQVKAE